MGRVASALGFTTRSLYRHVRSEEELLMQDTAVGSLARLIEPERYPAVLQALAGTGGAARGEPLAIVHHARCLA